MKKSIMLWGVLAMALLAGCQWHDPASTKTLSDAGDVCGAAHYQHQIGKPLNSVAQLSIPKQVPVRILPWNSAATMDFFPNRLNFAGDKADNINRVFCG
ncbi:MULTISPECIES: I78 family peptidase inhibitor [Pantoea]|uniref:Peptidase inhibitor I78 family protein n=1 Tax=Candidatus Pantoea multigeneris TaxID=2608357 RepID=A0ABX0RDL5_9GAMM|nr:MULTISPECIES: I78 family peptidase inhibitor [Pantoea]NIF23452.1 peptidase inhibitor I78 family protein [Pantoea multigeneris]